MAKRSGLILISLAMLMAVVTTFVVLNQLSQWRRNATGEAKTPVVVVVKAVAPHTIVGSTDVALKQVPKSALSTGAVTSLDKVVGLYTADQWFPGQQVISDMLVKANQPSSFPLTIPVGERAFTLADDAVTGVDHYISPGDHVDILVTYSGKEDRGPTAKMLLEDVLVLAVDNAPISAPTDGKATVSASGASSSASASSAKATVDTVTVAVKPQDSALLDYARTFGQLHLALRNPGDAGAVSVHDVGPANNGGQ